ncbi:MAG: glycosyltransferase family 4 protein [Verrucomicrobiae bacterium]|nr:glycosyltransferase family 4 protein [Verrucomicrobiae bacterium]
MALIVTGFRSVATALLQRIPGFVAASITREVTREMASGMRVCHVITRLIVGGAQENTLASCVGLRARGYEVDLVVGPQTGPEGSLHEQARAAGVPMIVLPELVRAPNPLADLPAARALVRLFRQRRYDLVHTHSGKAGFVGRWAARRAGVPIVVHTIHGPSFYRYQNPLGNWLFCWAEKIAAEWTTQFVSVADAMTQQYLAAGVGRPNQYVTIRSGMNVGAFCEARADAALRKRLGIEDGDLVVGKVARLFRLKGHRYLFEAIPRIVREIPNVKFLLVGDGPYRQLFERTAGPHVIFAGLVPPAEIPRYIAVMDVLVHLSLREGLPRTLPQALACGKPVVAFDVDGAREVCRDGETGFLIPAEDTDRLAEAVIRLLRDPALAHRMGVAGRKWVATEFDERRMVDQLDALYRQLARTCIGSSFTFTFST